MIQQVLKTYPEIVKTMPVEEANWRCGEEVLEAGNAALRACANGSAIVTIAIFIWFGLKC